LPSLDFHERVLPLRAHTNLAKTSLFLSASVNDFDDSKFRLAHAIFSDISPTSSGISPIIPRIPGNFP
jgi:hypothetical protein